MLASSKTVQFGFKRLLTYAASVNCVFFSLIMCSRCRLHFCDLWLCLCPRPNYLNLSVSLLFLRLRLTIYVSWWWHYMATSFVYGFLSVQYMVHQKKRRVTI